MSIPDILLLSPDGMMFGRSAMRSRISRNQGQLLMTISINSQHFDNIYEVASIVPHFVTKALSCVQSTWSAEVIPAPVSPNASM
jgi:hypothetical protein